MNEVKDVDTLNNAFRSIHVDDRLMGDVGFFLEMLFGSDNETNLKYFKQEAKTMLRALILHVLTADSPVYENRKTIRAISEIIETARLGVDGQDAKIFEEMTRIRHLVHGHQAQWVQASIDAAAHHVTQLHPKVRDDVFTVILSYTQPMYKEKSLQGRLQNA